MIGLDGYTISRGIISDDLDPEIVAVPLDVDERIEIGWIGRTAIPLTEQAQRYLGEVRDVGGGVRGGGDRLTAAVGLLIAQARRASRIADSRSPHLSMVSGSPSTKNVGVLPTRAPDLRRSRRGPELRSPGRRRGVVRLHVETQLDRVVAEHGCTDSVVWLHCD